MVRDSVYAKVVLEGVGPAAMPDSYSTSKNIPIYGKTLGGSWDAINRLANENDLIELSTFSIGSLCEGEIWDKIFELGLSESEEEARFYTLGDWFDSEQGLEAVVALEQR